MTKKIYMLVVLVSIISTSLWCKGTGNTSGKVLLLMPNASVNGFGNSGAGLRHADWQFINLNPAYVSLLTKNSAGFSYTKYIESTRYQYINYCNIESTVKYSFGVAYFDYGNIQRTTYSQQTGLESFIANDYIFNLNVSGYKMGIFHTGLAIKYFRETLDNKKASSFIVDVGTLYSSENHPFSLGIVVQNLGRRLQYQSERENLPALIKIGISYELFNKSVVVSGDVQKIFDEDYSIKCGIHYSFEKYFVIRTGFDSENDASKGETFGFGINLSNKITLDYALIPYDTFNTVHKLTFTYNL